jgi:hypothetical protein
MITLLATILRIILFEVPFSPKRSTSPQHQTTFSTVLPSIIKVWWYSDCLLEHLGSAANTTKPVAFTLYYFRSLFNDYRPPIQFVRVRLLPKMQAHRHHKFNIFKLSFIIQSSFHPVSVMKSCSIFNPRNSDNLIFLFHKNKRTFSKVSVFYILKLSVISID